jgi:glucan 1,3-beta-glucosidase
MLLSTAVLGLSTCASAVHARSYSANEPVLGDTGSRSTHVSTPVSSYSESLETSPVALTHNSLISSSFQASYTPRPTNDKLTVAPYPTKSNGTNSSSPPSPSGTSESCAPYWLESVKHQGLASFNPNPDNYTVFRNVKEFGARGDGVTDDTAAIQRAVTQGNRCGPSQCESSTNTPALVYFPEGTYLISTSIIDYYYTQVCFSTLSQKDSITDSTSSLAIRTVSQLSLQPQISPVWV